MGGIIRRGRGDGWFLLVTFLLLLFVPFFCLVKADNDGTTVAFLTLLIVFSFANTVAEEVSMNSALLYSGMNDDECFCWVDFGPWDILNCADWRCRNTWTAVVNENDDTGGGRNDNRVLGIPARSNGTTIINKAIEVNTICITVVADPELSLLGWLVAALQLNLGRFLRFTRTT